MKKTPFFALMVGVLLMLTSCEAVDTVFTAGKWWGIIVAVVVASLILFLFNMFRGKR